VTAPIKRSRRSDAVVDRTNVHSIEPGPQYVVRIQTGEPVSGRPDQAERQQLACTVGAELRRLRLDAGLSIRQLERRSGVHRSSISLVERGLRRPRPSLLGWLAFGIDPDAPEPVKKRLCEAAGTSLIADSRWSARSHARRASRRLLDGTMPLPPYLAAPHALALLGGAFPDRLDLLAQAQEAARRGEVPCPPGAVGSAESLAIGNELWDSRPWELAMIGRRMAAIEAAAAARALRRRERAVRARLRAEVADLRASRGLHGSDADLVAGARNLVRACDGRLEVDRASRRRP
jgi:transcriptional regulator with XRE-family HTH domain